MAEKYQEDFMTAKWRPAMGWSYMIICIVDMVIFPIIWSVAQVLTKQPITQWNPLTLQGAGLFHMAMGAVLGIAAFGRTQEKVAKLENAPEPVKPAPSTTPAQPVGYFASVPADTPAIVPAPAASVISEPVAPVQETPVATSSKVNEMISRFKKP